MRSAMLIVASLVPLAAAEAQATRNIESCTLITDPTALRLCLESSRQRRPASSFDPAARPTDERKGTGPDLKAPSRTGSVAAPGARETERNGADPKVRPADWRLKIP